MKRFNIVMIALLTCLFMTSANAIPRLILTFDQLVKAVEVGDDVKAIIHLDRCQITDPKVQSQISQNIDGASTRMNFTKYLHFKGKVNGQLKDTVTTTSESVVEQSTGIFWTIYGRLSVFDDNTATFHIDYYDTPDKKSQLVVDWDCEISNGKDLNGLYLYDNF